MPSSVIHRDRPSVSLIESVHFGIQIQNLIRSFLFSVCNSFTTISPNWLIAIDDVFSALSCPAANDSKQLAAAAVSPLAAFYAFAIIDSSSSKQAMVC